MEFYSCEGSDPISSHNPDIRFGKYVARYVFLRGKIGSVVLHWYNVNISSPYSGQQVELKYALCLLCSAISCLVAGLAEESGEAILDTAGDVTIVH